MTDDIIAFANCWTRVLTPTLLREMIGYAARHELQLDPDDGGGPRARRLAWAIFVRSSELRAGLAIVRMAQLPEALVRRDQGIHVATAAFVR